MANRSSGPRWGLDCVSYSHGLPTAPGLPQCTPTPAVTPWRRGGYKWDLHNQGRMWLGGRTGLWSKPLVLDFGGLRTTTVEFSLLAFPSLLFSSNLPGHQSPRPSLTRDPKGLLYWDGSCQLSLNLLLTQQTLNSPASSIECPQWVSFFLFRGKKDMQIILIFM